jgi:hypothetical protein
LEKILAENSVFVNWKDLLGRRSGGDGDSTTMKARFTTYMIHTTNGMLVMMHVFFNKGITI